MTYEVRQGDCADVLREYEGQADLILTSPPYDNLRHYGGHGFDFDPVADACVAALKPGGVIVWVVADATIDGSETGTSFRQALGFMERGLRLHDTMIYQKHYFGHHNANRYSQDWEYMFVLSKGAPATAILLKDKPNAMAGAYRPRQHGMSRKADGYLPGREVARNTAPFGIRSGVWYYAVGKGNKGHDATQTFEHPATFAYALAADHIRTWTNPGDLVIDPMAGSGTTIRAAVNLGRRAVGIEIHEPYVDLIHRRMAQGVMEVAL